MKDSITLKNFLDIYELEISKNIKNKRKVHNFEINKLQNITELIKMLKNGEVGHRKYNIFLIYEPKCRLVMSLSVGDKLINHFVTRFCLDNKLNKYLIDNNCATRKNMGTDYALKKVKEYIEKNKKYKDIYFLKIDIVKYFYSIDHDILKSLLKDKLDNYEYDILSKIIDSTDEDYINENIYKLTKDKDVDIPIYENNKGLPIGNMTSQFLSIFYLYELDHFVVHDLGLKYYIRYMDDILIISNDLNKLTEAKVILRRMLALKYKLKMHDKKTMLGNAQHGFSFLGYTFKVVNNKTIIKVKKSNLDKMKKRLKKVRWMLDNKLISYEKAFCSVMTYQYSYKYGD